MRRARWVGFVLVAVIFVVGVLSVRFLSAAGAFKSVPEEIAGACTSIEAVPGPEDMVVDREAGLAFVSGVDRRAVSTGGEAADSIRGGIYVIDLNQPRNTWGLRPVTDSAPADFRPHGIGLDIDANGKRSLFVVNHPASGAQLIEVFDVADNGLLTHRRTVDDPAIIHPNDVYPIGGDAFYITNDHGSAHPDMQGIEDFLLLGRASVAYFDGTSGRLVAQGLSSANGINANPDGTRLYVNEALGRGFNIYERSTVTGDLILVHRLAVDSVLDNIDTLEDGSLLIGAHTRAIDFVAHVGDPEALSPSEVIKITFDDEGMPRTRTLWRDHGGLLSGVSVAVGYRDIMLIGAVFQPNILICSQELGDGGSRVIAE